MSAVINHGVILAAFSIADTRGDLGKQKGEVLANFALKVNRTGAN
jgi:hypothetical protein